MGNCKDVSMDMPKIERVNTVSDILIHEYLPGKDMCNKALLIMKSQ